MFTVRQSSDCGHQPHEDMRVQDSKLVSGEEQGASNWEVFLLSKI
jgi:hypothetical protein